MDRVHPLRQWRRQHSVTIAAMAARLNVTPSFVSMLETGRKRPSLDVAVAIRRMTDGVVTEDDFARERGAAA